jgi:hypothetical protein
MICLSWFESRFRKTVLQNRLPPAAKGCFHVCGRWLELTPAFLSTSVSQSAASVPSHAGNTPRWRREQVSHSLLRRATCGDGRDGI